jgi:hypothetical protein
MKRVLLLGIALLLICSATVFAADGVFTTPILLTSCGQSADVLMMKTLLNKDSLTFDYTPLAKPGDLDGKNSVILVVGGSSKGLGAAKVSESDEMARVEALLKAAQDAKMPVIVAHLGGEARRGELSDKFIQLGAENATTIIVVKGGDKDGFISKIAQEKNISIESAETILAVDPVLKKLYGKSGE